MAVMIGVYASVYIWCAVVVPNLPMLTNLTVVLVAVGLVGIGTTIVAIDLVRQPKPLVSGVSPRKFTQTQARKLAKNIARHWDIHCTRSGLSVERRHGGTRFIDFPRVISLRPCVLGIEAIVETVAGQPPTQLVERAPSLSSALGVRCRIEPLGPTAAKIVAVLRNPLTQVVKISQFPALAPENMSVSFGRREDGSPAIWSWKDKSGAVIGGEPGAGKTAAATVLVGPLLLSDYANVHIVDGKGGHDWSWAKPCADSFTNDALNFEDVATLVEQFESKMVERLQTDHADEGTSNFWSRTRTTDEPFELLVIDECQTYFNASGRSSEVKKIVQRIAASVENTVRKGRAAGVGVLLMSQKPTADSIPTSLRDNAGLRMAFKVNTRAAEEAVLGELPEHTDDHLRAVNISEVGSAVINDPTGHRVLVRASYIDETTARTQVHECASQFETTEEEIIQ